MVAGAGRGGETAAEADALWEQQLEYNEAVDAEQRRINKIGLQSSDATWKRLFAFSRDQVRARDGRDFKELDDDVSLRPPPMIFHSGLHR